MTRDIDDPKMWLDLERKVNREAYYAWLERAVSDILCHEFKEAAHRQKTQRSE